MAVRVSKETSQSFRAAGRRISRAGRELSRVWPRGLRLIGEEIMTDTKDSRPGKGVPVDEGTLRSTGRVDGGTGPSVAARVELSFGGPAAPYALIQHENMQYRHKVGEPRYLVRALERWRPWTSAAMAAAGRVLQARLWALGQKGRT